MPIYVTPDWEGMYAEKSATENMRGVRFNGPANFRVVVDENVPTLEASIMAIEDYRIPKVYDLHPYTPWAFVSNVRSTAIGPKTFHIAVEYDAMENPLAETPETQWLSITSSKSVSIDANGKPITNSAGEPIYNLLQQESHDEVLRRRFNAESFNPILVGEYRGKINSDVFLGRPPGTCKLAVYNVTEKKTGPFWYYEIEIEIHIRYAGWEEEYEDKGKRETIGTETAYYYYWDSEGVKRFSHSAVVPKYQTITETMTDENGDEIDIPISEPVFLDGNGNRLPEGMEPVLLTAQLRQEREFALLGIA